MGPSGELVQAKLVIKEFVANTRNITRDLINQGTDALKMIVDFAKAGIRQVELNAPFIEAFIKTDTLDGARQVLTDHGLTLVHGAVPGAAGSLVVIQATKWMGLRAW